ncbi:MAG TPA: penicillin acylase family protein [Solirubrobacteraceae bacterium]|nr:penicillin acylase family protein [Solirubrobacteraceae bacterium]
MLALIVATGVAIAAAAPPAVADLQPYGNNDAGGFRNVLPPGAAGVDNATQFAQFRATGARPPHWADQQPLYDGLLYASPTLTHDQIASYYKDATFGVKPEDVASMETPRSGVVIIRDKQYGVPHIYGQTNDDVLFGEGYAGAEDRLFLMDVLRHTARGQLSSFAGGSAGDRAMDRTQWGIAPYTEADLQSQIDLAPKLYGALGAQLVDYLNNYLAGINAYINAAMLNPNLMPAEYAAFGTTPAPWKGTDLIAEASLIGGIFGKGGGNELNSAQTLQAFESRFGTQAGQAAWSDFRAKNDPEAPTTVAASFPYESTSPFATKGLAMPDPGSVAPAPVGPPLAAAATGTSSAGAMRTPAPQSVPIPDDGSIGSQLLHMFASHHGLASNWELVNANHSTNGHSIAVMGPQVGYYVPQILMEEDIHGPNFDARGATFPGVNLMVQLGHGRDYAWSATTATSDNVDTFAEVLCQDDYHYMYKGQCLPMEKLDRMNSWTPTAGNMTPAGSETLTAYRTVHGIVFARGTVNGGTKVAFVTARTTYFHEADSSIGLFQLNDPNFVRDPQSFQQAASNINFGFNWSYVDADHIAYYHSGWYPQRADGTSPDFPILGTGEFDWKGYDPNLHTLALLPFAQHPSAIDPDYLVSWNNKQAPNWSAADDQYGYSSVFRSAMIADRIKADIANGAKMGVAQLVQAMEEPASEDIRMIYLWPTLKQVLGSPSDPRLQHAIALLDKWYADGGHRRDANNGHAGTYADNEAVTLMDAWWPKLLDAEFHPTLGDEAFGKLKGMLAFGNPNPGTDPTAPDFAEGWYGYVSKDLRDLLGTQTAGSSPIACPRPAKRRATGKGRRARKRQAVTCRAPRRKTGHRHRRGKHGQRVGARTPATSPAPAGIPGAYSRIYCGNGSLDTCRTALSNSLLAALNVTPQQIYGKGDCASNAQAECYDQNRSVIASAIDMPPAPFQNRPTFQQVIELTQRLPRF